MVALVSSAELYLVLFRGTGTLGTRLIFGGSCTEGITWANTSWRRWMSETGRAGCGHLWRWKRTGRVARWGGKWQHYKRVLGSALAWV